MGLTVAEIESQIEGQLLTADAKRRIRDLRRQMVLPLDLSAVGEEGLELPILAQGYRVGSVWVDCAMQMNPSTGAIVNGFVFSLALTTGEIMGDARLQVVSEPEHLNIMKTQGWISITSSDETFYAFDEFVAASGLVLVHASIPLRFNTEQAKPSYRDPEDPVAGTPHPYALGGNTLLRKPRK